MSEKIYTKNRDEWLSYRKNGIGGSDCSVVMGVNKYQTRLGLYLEKIDPIAETPDNNAMWWGRELEPLVAKRFAELTGKEVRNDNAIIIDKEYPFFYANIDRKIVGENAILECKTTNSMGGDEWADNTIPDAYYCQLQWYLSITGYEKAYIACLIGTKELVIREVEPDQEFIKKLRAECYEFWTEHVEKRIPPTAVADDKKTLMEMFPSKDEKIVLLNDYKALCDARAEYDKLYKESDSQLKELKTLRDNCDAQIQQLLEGNIQAVCDAGDDYIYKITNKKSEVNGIDTDMLKEQFPDVYEKVKKITYRSNYRFTKVKK